MSLLNTALHESSHACAFLSRGIRVTELRIRGDGSGFCSVGSLSRLDRDSRAFGCLAGQFGPRLNGVSDSLPSYEDVQLADIIDVVTERRMKQRLEAWVWENERPIRFLAEKLLNVNWLLDSEIARLCYSPQSPLCEYAALYERPAASEPVRRPPPMLAPSPASHAHRTLTKKVTGWQRVTVRGAMRLPS